MGTNDAWGGGQAMHHLWAEALANPLIIGIIIFLPRDRKVRGNRSLYTR